LPASELLSNEFASTYSSGRVFRETLLSIAAELNPAFAGSHAVGGADADMILGGHLIELKVTKNPRMESTWLYQLLGYFLLDYCDEYNITDLGIYMARQSVRLHWPVADLFELMNGRAATAAYVTSLRQQFRTLLLANPVRRVPHSSQIPARQELHRLLRVSA